jgi:hypothetical protein
VLRSVQVSLQRRSYKSCVFNVTRCLFIKEWPSLLLVDPVSGRFVIPSGRQAVARLEDAANAASGALDFYGERFETFDADDMKHGGAFVVIDSDGQMSVERGLIRREDARKVAGGANAVAGVAVDVTAPKKAKQLQGEKLCRRLTAHRTAEIQAELARQPNAALAVLMSEIPVGLARMLPQPTADCWRSCWSRTWILRRTCLHSASPPPRPYTSPHAGAGSME